MDEARILQMELLSLDGPEQECFYYARSITEKIKSQAFNFLKLETRPGQVG